MGELGGKQTHEHMDLRYIDAKEIKRILGMTKDPHARTRLFAAANRFNTLYMIMRAGSGHIGSSFSAMDIFAWMWLYELSSPNTSAKSSDTFFSSKGHDSPALYSTLIALGKLPFSSLHLLRRIDGLPGHPDVSTPHIATNTGSLGMGISKAHGIAAARRAKGKTGRIYVVTGDGELQEGQFWESLQSVVNDKISEITVIIDHNKIQSDALVQETSDLGFIEEKLRAFGWEVARINGHDTQAISSAVERMRGVTDRPQIIIADTIKGKGVSFMEKIDSDGYYRYHSGAPSLEKYSDASKELLAQMNHLLQAEGGTPVKTTTVSIPARIPAKNPQKLIGAYSEELLSLARKHKEIVAMDADLILDTGLIPFRAQFPDRYTEAGIAEQDMVSRAGGLALQGMLPIVHSFACFLPTRANEQMYNNASEKKKIIYVASLAGLLPGGPGHSHQSVRDISIVGSIPGLTAIEPVNELETKLALRWSVETNTESTYIRLVSIPVELPFTLPKNHTLVKGRGNVLRKGRQVLLFAYGPVMLSEAYKSALILEKKGVSVGVVNLPWLNVIDEQWLKRTIGKTKLVVAIDDHYQKLGQGAMLSQTISGWKTPPRLVSLGLLDIPACGTNAEVLQHHELDAFSLSKKVLAMLRSKKK